MDPFVACKAAFEFAAVIDEVAAAVEPPILMVADADMRAVIATYDDVV